MKNENIFFHRAISAFRITRSIVESGFRGGLRAFFSSFFCFLAVKWWTYIKFCLTLHP